MATSKDKLERLRRVREKMLKKKGGFRRDPGEWKPPQVTVDQTWKAKAYILPPLNAGSKCASGTAVAGMDDLFFFQAGDHWVNRKKHPCPRIYDGDHCPFCQLGFNLLSETDDKKSRREISQTYLPRTQYVMNLYFPDVSTNPEELRGRVVFYAAPKTIFDKLDECLVRDSDGGDPDDPQPWGLFYDENDAYPLSISICKQGDYNSYTETKLLSRSGPVADSDEKVEEILSQRYDIPTKYSKRTQDNLKILQGFVDALMDGVAEESDDGFDTDEEEKAPEKAPAESKPVSKKKSAPKEETPAKVEEVVDVDDPELAALLNEIKSNK